MNRGDTERRGEKYTDEKNGKSEIQKRNRNGKFLIDSNTELHRSRTVANPHVEALV